MENIIAIILGNRLNDDGTITKIQEERLLMAIEINKIYNPSYIILSGGVANPKAVLSEAEAMYNYLINKGIKKEKLIIEKNSLTTVQNAQYSIPIAKELKADAVIVCSSGYHFADPQYKLMESFVSETKKHDLILMTYTK